MNYTFKNQLGLGGMATVYLAEDKKFQTDVAVKVLNKEFAYNQNIRKRFLAEARNMFKMSHPNIVRVTDMIEEDDTVAFVMEYIEGKTLKDYLEDKGKLSDKEITNLFAQMLEAVGYVHEQNLVHRDIKPSNFMLSNSGVVKLMDFGIAKNLDPNSAEHTVTGTNQTMGTPLYMSPEQVKSTKDVTPQSDIYSLGVVLWQMVTGRKPYDSSITSTFEIQSKIVNEPLPLTNTKWDKLIQLLTGKETSVRCKSIKEIKTLYLKIDSSNLKQEFKSEKTVVDKVKPKPKINSEKTIVEDKSITLSDIPPEKLNTLNESLKSLYFANRVDFETLMYCIENRVLMYNIENKKLNNLFIDDNRGYMAEIDSYRFYQLYFIPHFMVRSHKWVVFISFVGLAYGGWTWLNMMANGQWYAHWILKVVYTIILAILCYFSYKQRMDQLNVIYWKRDLDKVDKVIRIVKKELSKIRD